MAILQVAFFNHFGIPAYVAIVDLGRKDKGEVHAIAVVAMGGTPEEFLEFTKSVWTFSAERASKVGHPAPFPVELL